MSENRVRCPKCKKHEGLWIEATWAGWVGLDQHGKPTDDMEIPFSSRTDAEIEHGASGGCSCGWTSASVVKNLEQVDADDKPIHVPIPGQLTTAEANLYTDGM